MKKLLPFFSNLGIVLLASAFVWGQPCKPPSLRGFSLGMSEADVLNVVPTVGQVKSGGFGYGYLRINVLPKLYTSYGEDSIEGAVHTKDYPVFEGIDQAAVNFLDGSVFSVWVRYNSSPKWSSRGDFLEQFAQGLGLPNDFVGDPDRPGSNPLVFRMPCGSSDFVINLSDLSRPTVTIWDPKIDALLNKRKTDEATKNRKAVNL